MLLIGFDEVLSDGYLHNCFGPLGQLKTFEELYAESVCLEGNHGGGLEGESKLQLVGPRFM